MVIFSELKFTHILGSVQKHFGGVGWVIENFRRQTFLTPPLQAAKLFESPQHSEKKTLLTPHC